MPCNGPDSHFRLAGQHMPLAPPRKVAADGSSTVRFGPPSYLKLFSPARIGTRRRFSNGVSGQLQRSL